MKYRAIRPVEIKGVKYMPGDYLPDKISKSVIKRLLKQDTIAIKHEGEPKWQQDEPLDNGGQEPT